MDAFEQRAADLFWNEGYWVRTSVKVELTREEKVRIGRHSSPRWEIDLVAYHAGRNELLALGLEQEFNNLHAQREACEVYILSQRHEGWTLVPTAYDDGGFSDGNMERPGIKALMDEVDAGRVDVIVVYKVDRLTRSLADFAKIVERLDARQASFVSITQAFNTTTTMVGSRLTSCSRLRSSSVRSRASASATRSPPPRKRACGWAVQCHSGIR